MTRTEERRARSPFQFVGRQAELASIAAQLDECRLLTLTGIGGAGKTTLALEAVRRANERYRTDTFVVELASISTGGLVLASVLRAVGGRQEPGCDPMQTIASRLRDRPMRLVIDNCEQVSEQVAVVVGELLAHCPLLRVLVTARQPLALDGEVVVQVPPMSLPDADAQSPLSAVIESDAGRLFVACATAQDPSFVLSAQTASALTVICRALDGVPLAITLAAARVLEHSPREIAEGLTDRLRVFAGSAQHPTAPAHQRSLRASLEWSYQLLDPTDQVLFRRFAVLRGATASCAAAVCAPGEHAAQIDAGLKRLRARGLLETREDAVLGVTHDMLETVRQYALEMLASEGEQEAVRDLHMTVFGELAGEANDLLNTTAGRRELELHLPNMRAALARAIARDVPAALAMCERLAQYWFAADHFQEGRDSCSQVLAAAQSADPAARALVLWCAALLAAVVEDYAEAHELAQQGLALAEESGNERALGLCLQIANLALGTIDPAGAAETGRRAVELLRRAGNGHDLGHALMTLASVEALRDRFDSFAVLRAEFMSIPEARSDQWLRILIDLHAAWAYLTQGEPRSAIEQVDQVLEMVGSEVSMRAALARAHRLHAMARAGQAEQALMDGLAELDAAREAGSSVVILTLEQALAVVELALGDLDAARRRAQQHAGAPALHSAVLWQEILARIAIERGEPDQAGMHAASIRAIGERTGSVRQAALADYFDGLLALRSEDLSEAADRLHRGLSAQEEHGCRRDAIDSLEALGHLAVRAGDPTRGARLHAASAAARRALGCVRIPPRSAELRELQVQVDSTLGIQEAALARAEGERLSLRQAIGYAQRSRGRRQRALAGLGSLTPTETEVARLAAAGLSNPEIATRMFISRDTVKVHLSRAYGKLDITSRTQLGALLIDTDTLAVNTDG